MNKILFADSAGPKVQHLYGQSHMVLAGLVPAGLVSPQGSIPAMIADTGLAAAIALHSHVGLNYVVSDYVPKGIQVPVRAGVAGLSGLMFLGLLKMAVAGPGVTGAVKELWKKQ